MSKRLRSTDKGNDIVKQLQGLWVAHNSRLINSNLLFGKHICTTSKRPRIKMHSTRDGWLRFAQEYIPTKTGLTVTQFQQISETVYRVSFNKPYLNHTSWEIELVPTTKHTGSRDETDQELVALEKQIQKLNINGNCTIRPIQFTYTRTHCCIVEYCQYREQHEFNGEISPQQTFVCVETGTIHFCGRDCERLVMNSERIMTCELTGLTTSNQGEPQQTEYWSCAKFNPNPLSYRFYNALPEVADGDSLRLPLEPRIGVNIRLSGKAGYFMYTFNEITKCFSTKRAESDIRHNDQYKEEKQTLLKRRIERDRKQRNPITIDDLLAVTQRYELINKSHAPLLLDDSCKREVIERLSWKCMKLWYILAKHIIPRLGTPPMVPDALVFPDDLPLPTPYLPPSLPPALPAPSGIRHFSNAQRPASAPVFTRNASLPSAMSISSPSTPNQSLTRTPRINYKRRSPHLFGAPYGSFIQGALQFLIKGFSFLNINGTEVTLIEPDPILAVYPPWIDENTFKQNHRNPTRQRQMICDEIKKCYVDATKLSDIDQNELMLTEIQQFDDESIFS
jgi:hypothetical protein